MLDKRLVMVSGKGGVGKSAVAAAVARAAADSGRRALALSMTGSGMGLGAHLGSPSLGFKPTVISPRLSALAIDQSRALVEYLQIQLRLPSYATFTPAIRAFDVLATTAPAVREIVTMGKVLWEVKSDQWDLVVVDAPPTGQITSYLEAYATISDLVPSGRLADQADWMREVLLDSEASGLVLVATPEELPVTETLETLKWLTANPVVSDTRVIINRLLTPLESNATGRGAVAEAATLHRSLVSEQQTWVGELNAERSLPFLFGASDPDHVAIALSEYFRDSTS